MQENNRKISKFSNINIVIIIKGPSEELFIDSEYGVGSKFSFILFAKIQ